MRYIQFLFIFYYDKCHRCICYIKFIDRYIYLQQFFVIYDLIVSKWFTTVLNIISQSDNFINLQRLRRAGHTISSDKIYIGDEDTTSWSLADGRSRNETEIDSQRFTATSCDVSLSSCPREKSTYRNEVIRRTSIVSRYRSLLVRIWRIERRTRRNPVYLTANWQASSHGSSA